MACSFIATRAPGEMSLLANVYLCQLEIGWIWVQTCLTYTSKALKKECIRSLVAEYGKFLMNSHASLS